VLNFHHRGPFHKEIPYWIRWFILDKLRRFLRMNLPYANFRQQTADAADVISSSTAAAAHNKQLQQSRIRRMSLKMTIDNLQDELLSDMGIESRRTPRGLSVQQNCVNTAELLPMRSIIQPAQSTHTARSQLHEEVLKTLQVLISRQELDDECEEIANEWRQVAQVAVVVGPFIRLIRD
jgi:cell division protein FtsB